MKLSGTEKERGKGGGGERDWLRGQGEKKRGISTGSSGRQHRKKLIRRKKKPSSRGRSCQSDKGETAWTVWGDDDRARTGRKKKKKLNSRKEEKERYLSTVGHFQRKTEPSPNLRGGKWGDEKKKHLGFRGHVPHSRIICTDMAVGTGGDRDHCLNFILGLGERSFWRGGMEEKRLN